MLVIKFMRFVGQCMHCVGGVRNRISVFTACHTSGETELLGTDHWKSDGRGGTFLSCLNFFSCGLVVQDFFFVVYQPFVLCRKRLLEYFSP